MGAGFHNEIQTVNAERVGDVDFETAPPPGIMVPRRREDYQRVFVGDPEPQRVQSILHTAAYGEPRAQQELFDKMLESDLHLRCEAKKRCMAVTGLKWDVESASLQQDADLSEAQTKLADEIAVYVRSTLRRIKGLRTGLCYLIDAVARGLAVTEIEWVTEEQTRRPFALHCVPGVRLRYDHDDPWRLRITDSQNDFRGQPIDEAPFGKFIVHAPSPIGGMPVRGGLLRTAVPWYIFKHYGVQGYMKAMEIFGQPFRTATHQPNASEQVKAKMLEMLELMGVTAAGIFPAGTDFQVHESKLLGSGQWPQERLVKMVDAGFSKLFVGATLMTEVGDSGGNRALGEVQDDVRDDLRDDDIEAESETISEQLIRPIVFHSPYAAQGGLELLPRYTRVRDDVFDRKVETEVVSLAVNELGLDIPKSYVVEKLGIPLVATDDPTSAIAGKRPQPKRSPVEDAAAAVRSGAVVTEEEMRRLLGLNETVGEGKPLRFNDRDLLQYHIENDILTINEIREALGRPTVAWGNETPRARLARLRAEFDDDTRQTTEESKEESEDGDRENKEDS